MTDGESRVVKSLSRASLDGEGKTLVGNQDDGISMESTALLTRSHILVLG